MTSSSHTPIVHAFHDAARALSVHVGTSLYAEVSNHLIMVDYAAVDAPTPTPWAWDVWSRFNEPEREILRNLRCVLIHGLALQEYWFNRADTAITASTTWEELLNCIATMADQELLELVAGSVVSGIHYYRQEMAAREEIDAILPPNAEHLTANDLLSNPDLLQAATQADLMSWGVPRDRLDRVLSIVLDPHALRTHLTQLLNALWHRGSEAAYREARPIHNAWLAHARTIIRDHQWTSASDALEALTGRKPPEAEVERVMLGDARELVLIPCSHLGSSQRITTVGSLHVVMFEPSTSVTTSIATDQPLLSEAVSMMRAITDGPAFSLVQALARGDERYALQIAEDAGVHQSTVSRHLAELVRAGAVSVRPQGKAKYYRLNVDRIRKAQALVQQALMPDDE